MLYIGIDVHKDMCAACLQDEKGQVLREWKFENKTSGFNELLALVEGKETEAVMESTGNLWIRLYTYLEKAGIKPVLANPSKTKIIAESSIKTDKVDAKTLAHLLRADLISPCYVPTDPIQQLRQFLRHRITIVQNQTRAKNRAHAIFHKYELPEFEGTDLFGKAGLNWIKEQLPKLDEADQFILRSLIYEIRTHNLLCEETEKEIARHVEIVEEVYLLMTIIGVSFFTAMLFLAETGDINRFSSPSKLTSWIGLTPRVHQSGNTCYHGKITKKGSSRLRWALIQAAHSAVRFDPHWKAIFNRISARRGKQKAYVAVARKIVETMYCMLRNNEPYRYGREKTYDEKLKKLDRLIRKAQTNEGGVLLECFSF